jgi:hypothetical protein
LGEAQDEDADEEGEQVGKQVRRIGHDGDRVGHVPSNYLAYHEDDA